MTEIHDNARPSAQDANPFQTPEKPLSPILNLSDEYARIDAPDFRLGEYLYLGQIRTDDDETAVIAVAYKPDYAVKKLKENLAILQPGARIRECYLRKIRVGETDDCGKPPRDGILCVVVVCPG